MSRFILLVSVLLAVGQALVWSPTGTPDGAVLLTCDGSDVILDWPFVLDTGDQIQDIKWYFQPPGGAESFIATVLQDPNVLQGIQGHFFTPRDRLTHVPPAGLKVTGVKASDVGLYSVQLTTHSSGHDVVHTRSARIEMDNTQPNCTQQPGAGTQTTQQIQDLTQLVDKLQAEKAALTQTNQDLRNNVAHLETEKAALTQQVSTMTQQEHTTTQANQELRNNVTHFETETGILTQTNQDLYTNVTALENDRLMLTQQVQDLTRAYQDLQVNVTHCNAQEASCEQRIKETTETCTHIVEGNKAVMTQQIQALTQQNHDLQINVTSLASDNAHLGSEKSTLTQQLSQTTQVSNVCQSNLRHLESEQSSLTLQVNVLTTQNHDLQTSVTHLTSANATLTQQLSQETQLYRTCQSNLVHLESDKSALTLQVHSLTTHTHSLDASILSLQGDLAFFRLYRCPCGWHYYSGSCYVEVQQATNYTTAKRHCEGLQSKLAEITSSAENSFVTGLCTTNECYIGLTDVVQEGHFVYSSTGRTSSYYNWWSNQPNNENGNQDCVTLWGASNLRSYWYDVDCMAAYHSICEHEF